VDADVVIFVGIQLLIVTTTATTATVIIIGKIMLSHTPLLNLFPKETMNYLISFLYHIIFVGITRFIVGIIINRINDVVVVFVTFVVAVAFVDSRHMFLYP